MYLSDLQSLRLVQEHRAAVVVDSFDANSSRYFLPDSRLWQCAISRTSSWIARLQSSDFATAATCVSESEIHGGTCCPQHVELGFCQPIGGNRFHGWALE